MFCILQTLHLIPHSAVLKLSMLLPFTKFSLIQSPPLPLDFSLTSLGRFVSEFATTPFAFAYAYVLLRPIIEDRIYRIIRRHLPKQERPDEVSIEVAMENDLLEWTLPTAGRHTEHEVRRSNLTLFEDIKEELWVLQNWLSRWFGFNREDLTDRKRSGPPSHNDLGTIRENVIEDTAITSHTEATPIALDNATSSPLGPSFISNQRLTSGRFTHSPSEISPNSLDTSHPMERLEATASLPPPEVPGNAWLPFRDSDQGSRSDTLFSRPTSPESPLTSPRIRASLTHQNSFTTTMELSLQSSRNRNAPESPNPVPDGGDIALTDLSTRANLLDLNTSESIPDQVDQSTSEEVIEQPTAVVDVTQSNTTSQADADLLWTVLNGDAAVRDFTQPAVLPHVVEEPMHSPTNQAGMNQASEAGTEPAERQSQSLPPWESRDQQLPQSYKQRITVLSSYPADALAHHLAFLISGALFIPFESFYYRSLARSYLSSQAPLLYGGSSLVASSNIRNLNAFAGGGRREDMIAYMSKLALILGIQAGVSGTILGVCSATAVGIGKRFFEWGKL